MTIMEITLHPTLPSQLILGPRVGPGSLEADLPPAVPGGVAPDPARIQTLLVPIAKATFAADDPASTPVAGSGIRSADEAVVPGGEELRFEHDLAVFKPRADIVVVGAPAPPPPPEPGSTLVGGVWTETVSSGGDAMSQVFLDVPATHALPMTFGWEPRTTAGRRGRQLVAGVGAGHAGFFPDPPGPRDFDFDPDHVLPVGFNNLFANGGLYGAGARPRFDHLAPGDLVEVITEADYDVPGEGVRTVNATRRLHLPTTFPRAVVDIDDACGSAARTVLDLAADTVVYDKASARFTVTWRGAWDFAGAPADRYRLVRIEGGP